MSYSNKVGTTEKDSSMKISEAYILFAENYLFMKGYAVSTHKNYRWAIESLISVVGDIQLSSLKIDHIVEWRHYTETNSWDMNSVNSYMYKLRMFIKYWKRRIEIPLDVEDMCIPKRKMKLVKHLTIDEVKKVFKACETDRERLMIALLYSTGIRIGEMCQLRVRDIRGDTLLIRGKGGKERLVYLDNLAKECLKMCSLETLYVFPTYNGHISVNYAERLIKRLNVKTGIIFTAHVLRHTHATLLLSNGCSIRHIQELLGHADISTTQMYTHVSNTDLAGAYKSYHVSLV